MFIEVEEGQVIVGGGFYISIVKDERFFLVDVGFKVNSIFFLIVD